MMKKLLPIVMTALLSKTVLAQEALVTGTEVSIQPAFYIVVPALLIIIGLLIFLITKLKLNFNQVLKPSLVSLVISSILTVLLYFLRAFAITCEPGVKCPTLTEQLVSNLTSMIFPIIVISLVLMLVYFGIQYFKQKKQVGTT